MQSPSTTSHQTVTTVRTEKTQQRRGQSQISFPTLEINPALVAKELPEGQNFARKQIHRSNPYTLLLQAERDNDGGTDNTRMLK